MVEIKVLQFMRPFGKVVAMTTHIPEDLLESYKEMRRAGAVITGEHLGASNQVALTISNVETLEDYGLRVIPNGPQVPEALQELLRSKCWEGETL